MFRPVLHRSMQKTVPKSELFRTSGLRVTVSCPGLSLITRENQYSYFHCPDQSVMNMTIKSSSQLLSYSFKIQFQINIIDGRMK